LSKIKKIKVGILGGSFDPPHIGHLNISVEAKRSYKLSKIYWTITKKNPFKKKCKNNLEERILLSKKISSKKKYIKICFFEKKIKSNRTINLINYLERKFVRYELYLIIGADNLINFHKWYKWKEITKKVRVLVFDRSGYKFKALNSVAYKKMGKKTFNFVNFRKVNISSSKIRNFW